MMRITFWYSFCAQVFLCILAGFLMLPDFPTWKVIGMAGIGGIWGLLYIGSAVSDSIDKLVDAKTQTGAKL